MVGEGHAFDMIRRIKEGREASRLRRERANDKLKHLNRANEPYPLPNTTPEEMERIIPVSYTHLPEYLALLMSIARRKLFPSANFPFAFFTASSKSDECPIFMQVVSTKVMS